LKTKNYTPAAQSPLLWYNSINQVSNKGAKKYQQDQE